MRKFLLMLLTVGMLACGWWIFVPKDARATADAVNRLAHDIWYEKEILIGGDTNLADKTIRELLPTEKSNFWWWMNMDMIQASLKKSPWISKATIDSCATSFVKLWGCFVVTIEERKPSFLVTEGEVLWLVGQDGGFISPLTPRLRELFRDRKLKMLRGFYEDRPSSDLFNARFQYVRDAIEIIEKRTKRVVTEVQLLPEGEIEVSFEDSGYHVVFSGGADSAEPLHFELDRLEPVLDQFEGKEDTIQKVDLAFNKLAVVTLREQPTPVSTPRGGQSRAAGELRGD